MKPLLAVTVLCVIIAAPNAWSEPVEPELPTEVRQDLLMDQLATLLKSGDHAGVVKVIPQIRDLGIQIPDTMNFIEANALAKTGQALAAREKLMNYLAATGREGRYYEQASQLLLEVQAAADRQELEQRAQEQQRQQELARTEQKLKLVKLRQSQADLYEIGYRDVSVTGELDKPTRIALATFEIQNDLPLTGDVSDQAAALLNELVPNEDTCDELARYGMEPTEWGIPIDKIPAQVAVNACEDALKTHPAVIRFQIQYARALLAADRAKDALKAALPAAQLGYPAAETLLGIMYRQGLLAENPGRAELKDELNALRWFQSAAEKNYPEAMIQVGEMYDEGDADLRRASDTAMQFYVRAANLGYPPAQILVGDAHDSGRGLARDYEKAVQWYLRAAENGYPDAEYRLGRAYERGRGVNRNKESAVGWYRRASNSGHEDAKQRLARLGG